MLSASETVTPRSQILPWEVVEAMTLIGAMDCGDHLVFAADTETTSDDVRSVQSKIRRVQRPPIAWAVAGDQGLGAEFGDWLEGRTAKAFVGPDTFTPWDQLKAEAAGRLNELNGQRKAEISRARGQVQPNHLAGLLLAGCVGGRFEFLEIDIHGAAGFTRAQGHVFVGLGSRESVFALAAMRRVLEKEGKALPNSAEALREVMQLAHELMVGIGEIEMVKVTKSGVVDVSSS